MCLFFGNGESQVEPIKEEEEKAAKVAAITQTKMILSQNGVGNSHCLAQVYEITVVAGITKTSNVQEHYSELYSSVLFRLRTVNVIQGRLQFHNTDTSHIPVFILMSIEDVHDGVQGLTQLNPM
ncbi:pullulanase 1, chloroplastic [Tanacetum coccineum]